MDDQPIPPQEDNSSASSESDSSSKTSGDDTHSSRSTGSEEEVEEYTESECSSGEEIKVGSFEEEAYKYTQRKPTTKEEHSEEVKTKYHLFLGNVQRELEDTVLEPKQETDTPNSPEHRIEKKYRSTDFMLHSPSADHVVCSTLLDSRYGKRSSRYRKENPVNVYNEHYARRVQTARRHMQEDREKAERERENSFINKIGNYVSSLMKSEPRETSKKVPVEEIVKEREEIELKEIERDGVVYHIQNAEYPILRKGNLQKDSQENEDSMCAPEAATHIILSGDYDTGNQGYMVDSHLDESEKKKRLLNKKFNTGALYEQKFMEYNGDCGNSFLLRQVYLSETLLYVYFNGNEKARHHLNGLSIQTVINLFKEMNVSGVTSISVRFGDTFLENYRIDLSCYYMITPVEVTNTVWLKNLDFASGKVELGQYLLLFDINEKVYIIDSKGHISKPLCPTKDVEVSIPVIYDN